MEVMTLKQYAESKGISYEAVRKQVNRYQEQLNGHIIVKNRTQYIDEWAVNFLSERRRESPIVLVTEDQKERISQLTEQIESLKAQLMTAQNELIKEKDRIISLQGELREGIEERAKYAALLEDAQDKERRLAEAQNALSADREQMEQLRRELDQAQAEANSYHRSFFGFYRKG